jgi:hypothetical protein
LIRTARPILLCDYESGTTNGDRSGFHVACGIRGGSAAIKSYHYQSDANDDVQNVVRASPLNALFRREMYETCQSLIKINQSKSYVECPYQVFVPDQNQE